MHRTGTWRGVRTTIVSVVAASSAGCVLAASADARPIAAAGTILGGQTSQDWPIVLEMNKTGSQVVSASAGLRLTCTSGGIVNLPDGYQRLKVSSAGKFSASFGPITRRNDDGTTTDFEGSITGKFNKARTKVSGKWEFKGTDHDAAGAVTDTCSSGSVSWSAKA